MRWLDNAECLGELLRLAEQVGEAGIPGRQFTADADSVLGPDADDDCGEDGLCAGFRWPAGFADA